MFGPDSLYLNTGFALGQLKLPLPADSVDDTYFWAIGARLIWQLVLHLNLYLHLDLVIVLVEPVVVLVLVVVLVFMKA